jgi:hypothetical protein
MNETFGTKLRLQREEQQIPLAAIAEQTKIKLSLLEGLERDDVSRWPTGIFRRSYFRAYASAIGLEPDRVLREFQALYPDPHTEDEVTDVLAQARQVSPRRPPTRLRCLIDSAVNALPALHLQPSFRSVLLGVRTEGIPPVETPIDEVAPQPTWRRGTHPTQQIQVTYETHGNGTNLTQETQLTHETQPTHEVQPIHEIQPTQETQVTYGTQLTEEPQLTQESQLTRATQPAHETRVADDKSGVDFAAVAHLCTRLARALDVCDVTPVLDEAAQVLRAVGLILWVGDRYGNELNPVFTHGYSLEMTMQLGRVSRDSDNAIARAFRSAEARVVDGRDVATGAVVVPLLTPTGCAGVLALELCHGGERLECVRAAATILAAQLATLVSAPALAEAVGA